MTKDLEDSGKASEESTPEAVLALLKGCQNQVYNVCYQVLRHPQDAEDAAQEALFKVVEGLRSLLDIRQFDRWMYRVALNTALNFRKRRAIRLAYEKRRALMQAEARPGGDAGEHLHEAMARLDDDSRSLVIQHFFERRTLEELAQTRNCAVVTVWKKIDKAKTELERTLQQIGLAMTMPELNQLLSSIQPVQAPSSLISAVLAAAKTKMSVVPWAGKGALSKAGGAAIMAKGTSLGVMVGVAILLFTIGFGGGILKGSPVANPGILSSRGPETSRHRSQQDDGATGRLRGDPSLAPEVAIGSAAAPGYSRRLDRLRRLLVQGHQVGEQGNREASDLFYRGINEEWAKLRPEVYANPGPYFAFLRAPENDDFYWELLSMLCGQSLAYMSSGGGQIDIPGPVVAGLRDLMSSGTKPQRITFLHTCINSFIGAGRAELMEQCCLCLRSEQDQELRGYLLNALVFDSANEYDKAPVGAARLEGHLDLLDGLWSSEDQRSRCLVLLSRMRGEAGEQMFQAKIQEVLQLRDQGLLSRLPEALKLKIPTLKPAQEDRYLLLCSEAALLATDPDAFADYAGLLLEFPLGKAAPLLEKMCARSPAADLGERLGKVLETIRAGETRVDILGRLLLRR